jgi:mannose-1-phosphate guanylyltransferase
MCLGYTPEANGLASHRWAIILAAGDGARVRTLTTDGMGVALPKQFWSPGNDGPLIRWTLRRAGRLTSAARIVTVVAAQHRRLWRTALPPEALARVVVQPENRGTATGILLPLLDVLRRDPDATVAILPADHAVENEDILIGTLERALDLISRGRKIILLGMTPDLPDPSYGWILSGDADEDGSRPVLSFLEKPDAPAARDLFRRGAHWSSFILVARGGTLLSLYERAAPRMTRLLARVCGTGFPLERVYSKLPIMDFSSGLLERAAPELRMLAVPPCGWTDLGTPDRIERWYTTRKGDGHESRALDDPRCRELYA